MNLGLSVVETNENGLKLIMVVPDSWVIPIKKFALLHENRPAHLMIPEKLPSQTRPKYNSSLKKLISQRIGPRDIGLKWKKLLCKVKHEGIGKEFHLFAQTISIERFIFRIG